MKPSTNYSSAEQLSLWALAVFGFFTVNLAFLYCVVYRLDLVLEALKNPIALAFILEAFLLMGFFAYLLAKWKVAKLHWIWFVGLSLLGSMAFALPIVLLWPLSQKDKE